MCRVVLSIIMFMGLLWCQPDSEMNHPQMQIALRLPPATVSDMAHQNKPLVDMLFDRVPRL